MRVKILFASCLILLASCSSDQSKLENKLFVESQPNNLKFIKNNITIRFDKDKNKSTWTNTSIIEKYTTPAIESINIEVNSNFKKYIYKLFNANIIEEYELNDLRKEKFNINDAFVISYKERGHTHRIIVGKIDTKLDRTYIVIDKKPKKVLLINKDLSFDFESVWFKRGFINIPPDKIKEVAIQPFVAGVNKKITKDIKVFNALADLYVENICPKSFETAEKFDITVALNDDNSFLWLELMRDKTTVCMRIEKAWYKIEELSEMAMNEKKFYATKKKGSRFKIPYSVWTTFQEALNN